MTPAVQERFGNHDLDHRTGAGEKATGWIGDARALGATVDGQSVVGEWLVRFVARGGADTLALVTSIQSSFRNAG